VDSKRRSLNTEYIPLCAQPEAALGGDMQDSQRNLMKAKNTYKHHYDKRARNRVLREGDKELLLLPTYNNKMMLQWKGDLFKLSKLSIFLITESRLETS
jgi:hypothetical protein